MKKSQADALDRPFDPAILMQASELALQYRLILEPDDEAGYIGHALELPNVMADGKTPDKCVKAVREAVVAAVATLLELDRRPPTPAISGRRAAQINIRVSEEEKLMLEEAARQQGFRGVSDFIRTTTLAQVK